MITYVLLFLAISVGIASVWSAVGLSRTVSKLEDDIRILKDRISFL